MLRNLVCVFYLIKALLITMFFLLLKPRIITITTLVFYFINIIIAYSSMHMHIVFNNEQIVNIVPVTEKKSHKHLLDDCSH